MREKRWAEWALREATPEGAERFRPITRGPVTAALGVAVLGAVSLVFQAVRWIGRTLAVRRL